MEEPYPNAVGSCASLPPSQKCLPQFPKNAELVLDESNAQLLAALLPVLNKYQCLYFTKKKTHRSPWVRAFCDLYHPAGPWGSNKFENAPSITSMRKYSFKSYQIPTLYKHLTNYNGNSAPHLALKVALTDFFSKGAWYNEFLEGCAAVATVQVNKPLSERVAIPTVQTGVVLDALAPLATINQRKRVAEEGVDLDRPTTRAGRFQHEEESVTLISATISPLAVVRSPLVAAEQIKSSSMNEMECKRSDLTKFLLRRRESCPENDPLCKKVQSEIDKLDEKILELIMG